MFKIKSISKGILGFSLPSLQDTDGNTIYVRHSIVDDISFGNLTLKINRIMSDVLKTSDTEALKVELGLLGSSFHEVLIGSMSSMPFKEKEIAIKELEVLMSRLIGRTELICNGVVMSDITQLDRSTLNIIGGALFFFIHLLKMGSLSGTEKDLFFSSDATAKEDYLRIVSGISTTEITPTMSSAEDLVA